jgi:predicted transcriptional regulator of viral defense system
MNPSSTEQAAIELFRQHHGMLRTHEVLSLGIHPRTLYALRDAGVLQQLSRGLYRLADMPPLSNPDLVIVARRIPQAVICLVSALAYHNLTTQIPHAVDVALASGATKPKLNYPPLRVFRFSGSAWHEGVMVNTIDESPVRIYGPAKSVADSFKFRRRLGLDIALEALRLYRETPEFSIDILMQYARVCRVERVMRPYLEALL